MRSSPPEDPEYTRTARLSPASPKPLHYPSPSNIPILEKQMDPMLGEPAISIGTPASYQSLPQQTQTPSANSTAASYYSDQQPAQNGQNAAMPGSVGAAPAGYALATDSQMHNYSAQQPSNSYSDAQSAPSPQDTRSAYPYAHDASAYAFQAQAAHAAQANPSQPSSTPNVASVDVQALLDQLSPPATNGISSQYAAPSMSHQPAQSHANSPTTSLPPAPSLPPRPPPQEKSATNPNYNPNDDIRSYHPHSGHRGSTQLSSVSVRGGAGEQGRSNLSPSAPGYTQRQSSDRPRSEDPDDDDEDQRWPPEINRMYEEFLNEERKFVTEGQWEKFPYGSRLFIGNLPTEKVTKRDIFHRFYRHGKLAQISIKQAYGFVQFLDVDSCHKAITIEQGQMVRGRKMHLEVSKPQRNTKKAEPERNNAPRRRSRSPDYNRGGPGPYGRNANPLSPRDRDNRRFRDDFRRSTSPRRDGYRGRERSRERYDDRRRSRSRSRSRRRYRSPSPRRGRSDDLPLPFRAPSQIPDVQVLVLNEGLPRDFIRWVEDTFRRAGLRIDVLIMSPRLDESAVVQRQIVEGVLAVVRLNTATLAKGKIDIQIFDRRRGANNVQFDNYVDLDPNTAAALVIAAKQNANQPVQPPNPYVPGYGAPQPTSFMPPAPAPGNAANPPNLSNLITSLDPNSLSQLLGAMSANNNAAQVAQPPAGLAPDLARLLGQVSTVVAPPYSAPALPPQPYTIPYQNPFGGQHHQPPAAHSLGNPQQPAQPDMNEIMAQLAKYQR
ncbi:hypothetical protein P280DRAFT_489748 [Massarina eburnea CBS 473.64]|uniref:RRM domain-containing protein n=1 Tax=Massarina eburnea CBS 473.64 TaxID=1395130 RepID=A0A6A6S1B4_9PLEO|nr:hypothetical protein P280DRAFT_489748 [Massarina eburnea CBS 473.64]